MKPYKSSLLYYQYNTNLIGSFKEQLK